MSPGEDLEPRGERRPDRRVPPALVGGGVLGAALAAFVVQNTDEVEVTFLVFDARQPLWLILLITVAVALVLGELLGSVMRRRRQKKSRK